MYINLMLILLRVVMVKLKYPIKSAVHFAWLFKIVMQYNQSPVSTSLLNMKFEVV